MQPMNPTLQTTSCFALAMISMIQEPVGVIYFTPAAPYISYIAFKWC